MIGISYHSGGLVDRPLPWVIEHLGSLGYDAIEIVCGPRAHLKPDEATDADLARVRRWLADAGLRVAAINPYTVKPLAPMAAEGNAIDFFRRLIDVAVALDAPLVNFLPGRLPESDAAGWRLLLETLPPLLEYAATHGIALAIHNHEDHILDTPDKVRQIIDQCGFPNLVSLCDITNFWILGSEVRWSVERLGPHIRHCHVKGVRGRFPRQQFLIPGEEGDEFPFREFAGALGEIGYEGCISVETFAAMRPEKAQIAYAMMSAVLADLGLRPVR